MTTSLHCPDCGATYADRWRCSCGHPLEFTDTPSPGGPPDPETFDTRAGLWSYADLVPVEPRVTLGEGTTPLVDAPAWDAAFKLEYVFPTGSFKDRGATATLSRAAALGVERVVEDSSGNAGAAVATYAARAGMDARIFVPADVKPAKLRAIRTAGAEPIRVEGTRGDVTAACVEAVETGDAFYASHAWRPSFLAGTATVAYEIAHQRDWTAPDAVVIPVGHGTLLLGASRGFTRLTEAGWIDRVPRLYAAQATGHAPIVRALHGDGPETTGAAARRALGVDDATTGDPAAADDATTDDATSDDSADDQTGDDPTGAEVSTNERADGIAINDPVRGEAIVEAIRETGGDAIALDAATTDRELDRLGRAGFDTEPTCATAPAALRAFRVRGEIGPDERVVVPLTGSGLKTS
ncbi:MAG: pyridoxal-phosphate dependent enzyme [Halobaculum sp.]